MLDDILDATLMTQVRLKLGPRTQHIVLVRSSNPLSQQRLIARDLVKEGRCRKVEKNLDGSAVSSLKEVQRTIVGM